MRRTAIICIAVLLLTAAGALIIYRNHLQVEADIVAEFNERQLTMARLIGSEAELAVDNIRQKMMIASRISSIIKGDERCQAGMETLYGDLKEKGTNLLVRLDERGILTYYVPGDRLKGAEEKDFSFRDYFREVKKTGRPCVSGMFLEIGRASCRERV